MKGFLFPALFGFLCAGQVSGEQPKMKEVREVADSFDSVVLAGDLTYVRAAMEGGFVGPQYN